MKITRPPGPKTAGRHSSKFRAAQQRKAVYKGAAEWSADQRAEVEKRDRDTYGDLLPHIQFLRTIAPVHREGDLISVGGLLKTPAEVRAMADRERRLRQPAAASEPVTTARKVGQTERLSADAYCPCGRLASHFGRCWHRRALAGPTAKATNPNAAPTVSAGAGPIPGAPAAVTEAGDRSGTTKAAAQVRDQARYSTDAPWVERQAAAIESAVCAPDVTTESSGSGDRSTGSVAREAAAAPTASSETGACVQVKGPAGSQSGPLDTHAIDSRDLKLFRGAMRKLTAGINRLADVLERRV